MSGTYETGTPFLAWGERPGRCNPSPLCQTRMHSWRTISSNVYVFLRILQETSTCRYGHTVTKAIAAPSRCLQQDKRRRRRRRLPSSSPTPAVRTMAPFLGGLAGPSQARGVKAEQGGRAESRRPLWLWGCVGSRL